MGKKLPKYIKVYLYDVQVTLKLAIQQKLLELPEGLA